MNRTTGSTIFNTLYWLFPVLLTGLVFFDESKTAIYGIIITKKKRCVYLCSKALSVFFVSFVSTLFLFLLNLFLVYVTCPSSMELSETMIPHTGTFSALLFQKSPLYEAVTYVILHAFALSLLTVLYLAIQMIVKAKNKYMAFILPPIIMYVLDYLTQTAAQTYSVTMALQPMVARATSFVITIDEPFNALDEKSVLLLRKLLCQRRDEGKLIIVTSHHKDDIEAICDEVIVMQDETLKKPNDEGKQ